MITKTGVKSIFYLDRDTDINKLAEEINRVQRSECIVFLQRQHERLQEKEAGEYFTVENTLKLKEGELEKMQRFFRGAVVPYYVRQKYNIWTDSISSQDIIKGTEEIKRAVGFMRFDATGHITSEVNSMGTFERVKDLNEFLTMIEAVCFQDNDFIFPDSEHFKKLEKLKGRQGAEMQTFQELYQKVKNKYFNREILD